MINIVLPSRLLGVSLVSIVSHCRCLPAAALLMGACLLSVPAHSAPTGSAPATSPASKPARGRGGGEYRFDALRIDGRLRGPEAMDIRAAGRSGSRSLLRLRRSFLHRVFETVECAALHGGR